MAVEAERDVLDTGRAGGIAIRGGALRTGGYFVAGCREIENSIQPRGRLSRSEQPADLASFYPKKLTRGIAGADLPNPRVIGASAGFV